MVRIFLFIALFTAYIFPQEFSIKAYTDTSEYLIGDHIKLSFIIEAEKGISFSEPSFRDSIKDIDIISINTPEVKEGKEKTTTSYSIILSRYDSADVKIEPITFYYWHGAPRDRAAFLADKNLITDTTLKFARSNPVSFRINAVKVNIQEDIKDIKEPLTIAPDWRLIALYIFLGIIIITAAVYFYSKYRKKRQYYVKPAPILPPHVVALNSLNGLDNKKLWQKGLIKEYHSELTGIIRRYFEERFKLPALEMTSGETITLLSNTGEAKNIIEETEIFLNNADLVKFAKFIPMNEVNEQMMRQAYRIVEQTVPEKADTEELTDVQ